MPQQNEAGNYSFCFPNTVDYIYSIILFMGNCGPEQDWVFSIYTFYTGICSLLYVETADRPGLLVDLVKIITDINIDVESGEFDTEVIHLSIPLLLGYSFEQEY